MQFVEFDTSDRRGVVHCSGRFSFAFSRSKDRLSQSSITLTYPTALWLPESPTSSHSSHPWFSSSARRSPGPSSRITVFRCTRLGAFGLNNDDGLPDLINRRLKQLPSNVQVNPVKISTDDAGQEIVTVTGRIRWFFGTRAFTYVLRLALRPNSEPGQAQKPVFVAIAGPATVTGFLPESSAIALRKAVFEGVEQAANTSIKGIAILHTKLAGADFNPTHVSLTRLSIGASFTEPNLEFQVHGGMITGGLFPPVEKG